MVLSRATDRDVADRAVGARQAEALGYFRRSAAFRAEQIRRQGTHFLRVMMCWTAESAIAKGLAGQFRLTAQLELLRAQPRGSLSTLTGSRSDRGDGPVNLVQRVVQVKAQAAARGRGQAQCVV